MARCATATATATAPATANAPRIEARRLPDVAPRTHTTAPLPATTINTTTPPVRHRRKHVCHCHHIPHMLIDEFGAPRVEEFRPLPPL